MPKCSKYKVVLLLLFLSPCLSGQGLAPDSGQGLAPEYDDDDFDWRWGFFGGAMNGDTVMETSVSGEFVSVSSDSGWLAGLRLEADKETWGFDISISTVQADLDLRHDPLSTVPSASKADIYMGGVSLLWYPTGDTLGGGRVKPFLSGGTGLGVYDSDFSQIDGELIYDLNMGLGMKWFLGDEGKTAFRVDYRYHLMEDFDNNFHNQYRQSITAGLSFDF